MTISDGFLPFPAIKPDGKLARLWLKVTRLRGLSNGSAIGSATTADQAAYSILAGKRLNSALQQIEILAILRRE
jgi:hypothetical protein